MSDKGIYTAVSGAIAQSAQLETISNNIANVNTPSFKKDQQVFQEYLTSYEKAPDVIQVPRVPASIESFHDMNGGDKSYVDVQGTFTDFSQGAMKPTKNALDMAIEGPGFFEVLTPNGVEYTRNGSFMLNADRQVVTKEGFPVLMAVQGEGQPPESRVITLEGKNLAITEEGELLLDNQPVGRLSVVQTTDPQHLVKAGGSRYRLVTEGMQMAAAENSKVHQGFLEGSNVNIVKEMTDLIKTSRVFESTQKVIQAYDNMKGKVTNDIPKL